MNFNFSMDLKKYAVLSEMKRNSGALFSTSRLPGSCAKQDKAWSLISKFGHEIELTDTILSRHDFRALISRWKGLLRVSR